MSKYTLHIKDNNGSAPSQDYEDDCNATTPLEAAEIFYGRLPFEGREEWNPKALLRHIEKEEPNYDQVEELEKRLPVNI